MAVVFERPKSLLDVPTHYCPGCTHGIVHRILCEVIDEMGIEGDTIGVWLFRNGLRLFRL